MSLTKCASSPKSRPASQQLGVQHTPILILEPESVVIDELHLLLRVGDACTNSKPSVGNCKSQQKKYNHTHSNPLRRPHIGYPTMYGVL